MNLSHERDALIESLAHGLRLLLLAALLLRGCRILRYLRADGGLQRKLQYRLLGTLAGMLAAASAPSQFDI